MEKLLSVRNDHLHTFSEQARNCFTWQNVWMVNPKHRDWPASQMLHIWVLTHLSLKLLLSTGQNISSKNGFMIFFLMKTVAFHQWFSIYNLCLNTHWVEKDLLSKKIHFPQDQCFFCKFRTLHISKINSFLDLKQNTTIRQNLIQR